MSFHALLPVTFEVPQGGNILLWFLTFFIKSYHKLNRVINIHYHIFWPIMRALSIQKGSEILKNEHAQYMLERFPTDNARVICTKKGIGKYGIMY